MPSGKFLSSAEHRSRANRSGAPSSNSTVVMLSTFSWRPDPSSALERWTSAAPQAGISDRRRSPQQDRRCDVSGLTIGRCAPERAVSALNSTPSGSLNLSPARPFIPAETVTGNLAEAAARQRCRDGGASWPHPVWSSDSKVADMRPRRIGVALTGPPAVGRR
jgi:hypothetical protein